jgi:hypothetical protein
LALHELLSEPAGDPADNDGCDPADLMLFHWRFLPAGDSRTNHNVMLARCPADFDRRSPSPLNVAPIIETGIAVFLAMLLPERFHCATSIGRCLTNHLADSTYGLAPLRPPRWG